MCVCVCEAPLSSCCSDPPPYDHRWHGQAEFVFSRRCRDEDIRGIPEGREARRLFFSPAAAAASSLRRSLIFSFSFAYPFAGERERAVFLSEKRTLRSPIYTTLSSYRGTYSRFRARPLVELRLSFCVPRPAGRTRGLSVTSGRRINVHDLLSPCMRFVGSRYIIG